MILYKKDDKIIIVVTHCVCVCILYRKKGEIIHKLSTTTTTTF
jgi:hypothetical protein